MSEKTFALLAAAALGAYLTIACDPSAAGSCESDKPAPAESPVISIRAVGDIVLGSDWPAAHYPPGFEQDTAARLRQVLGNADIVFGNFEGALTAAATTTKRPGTGTQFAFRMPPAFAGILRNAGFNVIHIANNHTYDFGERGFSDTVANLTAADILLVGQPDEIVLQKIKGVTVAWIGFTYLKRFNLMNDDVLLERMVRRARTLADLVVVSLQAGAEGSEALRVVNREEMFLGENRGNTFAFARRAIDLGADLVLGHGPHVLRGMECYKGKLIFYSLGNFVGYGALSIKRAAAITAVAEARLTKDGKTLGYDVLALKFDEQHLPEPDADGLARYLINDLSRLKPLTATVKLSTADAGLENYRRWLKQAELTKMLAQ